VPSSSTPFTFDPFATLSAFPPATIDADGLTLAYKLTIFDAAGTTPAHVFSSVPTDAAPYIASVPSGDGQEVDLITGAVRTGAYGIAIVDAVTGSDGTGTLRTMTQILTASGRQHLLSRRAELEISTDGGNTYPFMWMAGYVTTIRQVDAITYSVTISDSRRIEQNHRAFTWGINPQDSAKSEQVLFPSRGCLLGGPIINGFGPTKDSGGIETELAASETAIWSDNGNRIVALKWLSASDQAPNYTQTRDFGAYANYANKVLAPFGVAATAAFYSATEFAPLTQSNDALANFWFPSLRVYMTDGTNTWIGGLRAFFPWTFGGITGNYVGNIGAAGRFEYIYVTLDAGQPALPSVGTPMRVRVIDSVVSEVSPLYFDEHPVDVVTKLYDSVNIPYDTASAMAIKNLIGPGVRLACRFTESQVMGDFLSKAIFGPFGFSARTDSNGNRFFFSTRIGEVTPSLTIRTDDLVSESVPSGFDVDEVTVATAVNFSYRVMAKAITDPSNKQPPPPDGIVQSTHRVEVASSDTSTFSTRVISYDIPGMVHNANAPLQGAWQPDMAALIAGITNELFDRYGRGAPTYELAVIRGTEGSFAQVGDEVLITAAHVPNQNYRIGESTIGPRVAQVVRRDETPVGPVLKLVDSGPDSQLATAPIITIAKETLNPRTLASFTITNAATLNTAVLGVEVEYATGASTPTTNGMTFTRYAVGEIPTGAVLLPAFVPGTRVWVRARSVAPESRPSLWTAWANVALDAWVAPSALTVGTISATSVNLSWTNGNAYDQVAVYLYQGASDPADWEPYRVTTLPPNSTQTVVRGLTALLPYRVAVAHADAGTGAVSTYALANFSTTASTLVTAPRVSYMAVIPTVVDAQFQPGIALGLWAGDESLEMEIQRAPDVAGAPGTWVTIAVVPGSSQVFGDPLPQTGLTFWYRSRHVGGGFTPSAFENVVSGVVGSLPSSLTRPSRPTASISAALTFEETQVIVTWTAVGNVVAYSGTPSGSNAVVSPQPTSPWAIPRLLGGVDDPYFLRANVGDQVSDWEFTVPAQGLRMSGITAEKLTGTTMEVLWAQNWTPSGFRYELAYAITADGSGSGVEPNATNPDTITVTSLGTAPAANITVTAYDSAGGVATSANFSGLLLTAPPPTPPVLLGVSKLEQIVSIACGVNWEVRTAWITSGADDTNFEIVVRNFDTNAVVASGLTTASSNYTEDTGETGDTASTGTTHTRRYIIQLVRSSDSFVVSSLNTQRLSVETGPAC
jgi:hypothetical protein